MTPEQSKALRAEFAASSVGKIPRKNKQTGTTVWLDYVGHAEVTDRLLAVDPEWNWEPVAWDGGSPVMERTQDGAPIGLWGRLTICGVTRVAYGSVERGTFEPEKQLISDLIRNGAMRFGVALDLWAKSDLHQGDEDSGKAPAGEPLASLQRMAESPSAPGTVAQSNVRENASPKRPANIDEDGVVTAGDLAAVGAPNWPAFWKAMARAKGGTWTLERFKAETGNVDAHTWKEADRARYLATLGNAAQSSEPPASGIVPRDTPHWSDSEPWGQQLFDLFEPLKLTEARFSGLFNIEVTQHNFVRLVNEWLAANPGRDVAVMAAMASPVAQGAAR